MGEHRSVPTSPLLWTIRITECLHQYVGGGGAAGAQNWRRSSFDLVLCNLNGLNEGTLEMCIIKYMAHVTYILIRPLNAYAFFFRKWKGWRV